MLSPLVAMPSTNPGARTCSSTARAAAQPTAWFSKVCSVDEVDVAVRERRRDAPVHSDHRDRPVAGGKALRAHPHIGVDRPVVAAEHASCPAEPGDHLVRDQDDVVLVADLADALEVPGRGRMPRRGGTAHGLHDERRDALRPDGLDELAQVLGDTAAVDVRPRLGDGIGWVPVEGHGHARALRQQRRVRLAALADAARGERGEGVAVVRVHASHRQLPLACAR